MSASLRYRGINLYERMSGRRILQTMEELLRTQWLSRDELDAIQRRRLQALLEYVSQHVPYYRRVFQEIGCEPGDLARDPECFRQIPIVDKAYIREHSTEFMTTDPAVRQTMQTHSTTGSTGHPFIFWEDHTYRDRVTADIMRHLTWSGWKLGEPHAYLWGGHLDEPPGKRVRAGLMSVILNRFYADAFVLSDESMRRFAMQIRRRRPRLVYGYASALFRFARFLQDEGMDDVKLPAVYSSAEVLYPHQRKVLEEVFGCPVFNRYAALETGGLACECEAHHGLHMSVENVVIEIVHGDRPALPGEAGDVAITNLNNYGFPFIRYRTGDVACLSKVDRCPCGRQHPMLEEVEGRKVDMFKTRDGRTIWGDFYTSTMFEVEGIKQYQMVQKSLDLLLVRLVLDDHFHKSQLDVIERTVKRVLGPHTEVKFEFLDSIPVGSGGKFRYAISEVPNPK
jgi:phenylacetate-CoA ligase